jgi:DNA-binding transcriptional ArsR family regulator
MDITNPLRSLAPTVDGDVLAVLARSQAALTGRRVQQLAGRSYAQVREVLHRLVAHGLVDAARHGNVVAYSLNREHVLATAIETASAANSEVERRLQAALKEWVPAPAAAALFGSFSRRDGDAESDVDLLLIRPDDVPEDDAGWTAQRYHLARQVERWTGNNTQIVELSSAELDRAINQGDDLIAAVRRDGYVVVGPKLRSLLHGR